MQQLIASCRTQAFSELMRVRVAGRGVSIGYVLDRYGCSGLLAIAEEVGAAMDRLTPTKKACGVVGAEAGILYGIAVGLIVSGTQSRGCSESSTVH